MRDDDWHGTGMAGSSVTHFMFPADNFALRREWPRWRMGHKLGGVANPSDRAMGGRAPPFREFALFTPLRTLSMLGVRVRAGLVLYIAVFYNTLSGLPSV